MSNLLVERLLVEGIPGIYPANWFEWMGAFFDNQPQAHRDEFVRLAKAMPNDVFERTMYWRQVTSHVMRTRERCHRCAYPARLLTHHLTYEHRGLEHQHLEDLELLCQWCHDAEHVEQAALRKLKRYPAGGTPPSIEEIKREILRVARDRRLHQGWHRRLGAQDNDPVTEEFLYSYSEGLK